MTGADTEKIGPYLEHMYGKCRYATHYQLLYQGFKQNIIPEIFWDE